MLARFAWIGLAALVALSLAGFANGQQGALSAPGAARRAVVISVDGMGASWYVNPPAGLRIPNLLRLKREGSFAEGVIGVYPTLTYPSHTTIVTGRMPAEHGIYTNLSSREAGKNSSDWFWFSSSIKVPTLWDVAHAHHRTCGSVSWPVTAGAQIDWDFPEIWDPRKGAIGDPAYVAKYATPGLAFEAFLALGMPQGDLDNDAMKTRLAIFLLKNHAPDLLLVHLGDLDHAEHAVGPGGAQAATTLEAIDADIGQILGALKEIGREDSTDVFVVSDHGFLSIEREIQPNVLLAKAGLLTVDERGYVSGGKIATVATGGSFFVYWPEGQDFRSQVTQALEPLVEPGLVWAEFDREALAEMGADPGAQLALEAPQGAFFGSRASGQLVSPMKTPGGTHGQLPFRKGLACSFIAAGPGINAGRNLHDIPITAVGPTILKALGINDPQFGAHPPLVDIFK